MSSAAGASPLERFPVPVVHDGAMVPAVTLPSETVPRGAVIAVEAAGAEYVLWRGDDGTVRSGPRTCPHLDEDLAHGYVVDCELVCVGHGWAFDGAGHTYKRNEFGRVDPKGAVPMLTVVERDGIIECSTLSEST